MLVRRPVRDNGEFQSAAPDVSAIFHGDLDAGFISPGFRIDARDVRSSEKDGRKWLDYEWMLSRHNDGKIIRVTMKVDAAARLPVSLQLDSGDQLLNYSFNYPAQGPADIYAVEVAREKRKSTISFHRSKRLASPRPSTPPARTSTIFCRRRPTT